MVKKNKKINKLKDYVFDDKTIKKKMSLFSN